MQNTKQGSSSNTVRIPVRFQGLSPRFQTVYCIPYSTITPVLRCVLSVVRAVYYEIAHSYKAYIASVIAVFVHILYLSLPESYNNIYIYIYHNSFIASIRYHFWLTEFPPKFDSLGYFEPRS